MPSYSPAALLLTLLALGSCSKKAADSPAPAGALAFNDFDNLDGWMASAPNETALSRDKAHSGRFSTRVDSVQEYSIGYSNTLGNLAPDWPPKLTISAWVLVPNAEAGAKLVTEVKGLTPNTPNLLWDGLDLAKAVKAYNKWQYVEHTVAMPDASRPKNVLRVYLWRAESKAPVYLDDLQIKLGK